MAALFPETRVFQNPSVDQCLGPESGPALRHWRLPPLEPWTMQSPRAGLEEEPVWGWPPGEGVASLLKRVPRVASETSPLSHQAGNPQRSLSSQSSGCREGTLTSCDAKGPLRSGISGQAEPQGGRALWAGGPCSAMASQTPLGKKPRSGISEVEMLL